MFRIVLVVFAIVTFAAGCGSTGVTEAVGVADPANQPGPTQEQEPTPIPTATAAAKTDPEPADAVTVEPDPTPTPTSTPSPAPLATAAITDNTLPSANGAEYTVWIDDVAVATLGDLAQASFGLESAPERGTPIVITQSGSPIVAGTITDGAAELTFTELVGVDFVEASGQYILATPTDGTSGGVNERSGVWWTFIPRSQSLFLPELSPEWVYEGWTIIDGVALTSGTFTEPFGSADNSAPFSGPQPGPPLVGEDYLLNAPTGLEFPIDLRDQVIAVTVEPAEDPDPAPSAAVVLRGTVPGDAIDHTSYSVKNLAATLPAVSLTITTP